MVTASDNLLSSREEILEILRSNLTKVQTHMNKVEDKRRMEVHFEVDSRVHVKLHPYRQTSLAGRSTINSASGITVPSV